MTKETGLYHADIGYVQVIGEVNDEYMAALPKGTIQVPLRPTPLHEWVGGAWRECAGYEDRLGDCIRAQRAYHLNVHVDQLVSNPLRWETMSVSDKNAIIEYRKQLLDITKQKGFPRKVVWPEPPKIG